MTYAEDTFDVGSGFQPLEWWALPDYVGSGPFEDDYVTNGWFLDYRNTTGYGEDF